MIAAPKLPPSSNSVPPKPRDEGQPGCFSSNLASLKGVQQQTYTLGPLYGIYAGHVQQKDSRVQKLDDKHYHVWRCMALNSVLPHANFDQ